MRPFAFNPKGFTLIEMLLTVTLVSVVLLLGTHALYQITIVHHDSFPHRQKQLLGVQLLLNHIQDATMVAERIGVSDSRYWTGDIHTQAQLSTLSNLTPVGTGTPTLVFTDNSGNVTHVLTTLNPSLLTNTEQAYVEAHTPHYTTVSTLNGNVTRNQWDNQYLVQFWTWVGGQYQLTFQIFLPNIGTSLMATVSGTQIQLQLPSPATAAANVLMRTEGTWNTGYVPQNIVYLSGKEVVVL